MNQLKIYDEKRFLTRYQYALVQDILIATGTNTDPLHAVHILWKVIIFQCIMPTCLV